LRGGKIVFKVQEGNSAERNLRGAKDIKDIIFRQRGISYKNTYTAATAK